MIVSQQRRLHEAWSMLAVLALVVLLPCAAAQAPALEGRWALDAELSDDPEDAFDDMLRRLPYPVQGPTTSVGERKTNADIAQEAYWETIRKSRERRSTRNLHRLGTAYPLITAERLAIASGEDGLTLTYDALPRIVRPNPAGRVFSASGEELTSDSIGHTLTYWEDDVLVLETDSPGGGKYREQIRLAATPRRLEYRIEIRSRVLKEPVTLRRVFVPAPHPP